MWHEKVAAVVFLGLLAVTGAAPSGPSESVDVLLEESKTASSNFNKIFRYFLQKYPSYMTSEGIENGKRKILVPLPGADKDTLQVGYNKKFLIIHENADTLYIPVDNNNIEVGQWSYKNGILRVFNAIRDPLDSRSREIVNNLDEDIEFIETFKKDHL